MSQEGRAISEVLQPYNRYWNSGEINTPVFDQAAKLKQIAETYSDGELDWIDGLTIDYPDWWFSVRGSNTEPLLRLNVEARQEALGNQKMDELLELIKQDQPKEATGA